MSHLPSVSPDAENSVHHDNCSFSAIDESWKQAFPIKKNPLDIGYGVLSFRGGF